MQELIYWAVGILWIIVCLALGFYIRTKGDARNKFKHGVIAIFVSYVCGVGILIAALYI